MAAAARLARSPLAATFCHAAAAAAPLSLPLSLSLATMQLILALLSSHGSALAYPLARPLASARVSIIYGGAEAALPRPRVSRLL